MERTGSGLAPVTPARGTDVNRSPTRLRFDRLEPVWELQTGRLLDTPSAFLSQETRRVPTEIGEANSLNAPDSAVGAAPAGEVVVVLTRTQDCQSVCFMQKSGIDGFYGSLKEGKRCLLTM